MSDIETQGKRHLIDKEKTVAIGGYIVLNYKGSIDEQPFNLTPESVCSSDCSGWNFNLIIYMQ